LGSKAADHKSSVHSDKKREPTESIDDTPPSTAAPNSAHSHRDPVTEISTAMGEMMEALRSMLRTMQETNDKIVFAQALASNSDVAALSAKLDDAIARLARGQTVPIGEVRGMHQTFATIRPPKPVLNWPTIYPVLYPGAPIPPPKGLVGGAGWTLGPPCAACAKHRPEKTQWFAYDELAKNPAYLGQDGRLDNRKLPPDTAILHNPGRCPQLHKDVNEHVAAHPSDMWMLKKRLLPARRP